MYNRKKKIAIFFMLVIIIVMAVGYAAFSTNLTIEGTANIASNWNVYISNVNTKIINGNAENASGSPVFSNLSATMTVNLKEPGDYIVYRVAVTNGGTLDAVVEDIKAVNLGTSAIKHSVDGVKKGDFIAKGDKLVFTVTVEYDKNITIQPEELSNTLLLDIKCTQALNQDIEEDDFVIEEPSLVTLLGANRLKIDSTFPTTLVNYKIMGDSVQNGTPSPNSPVEIQSVGEKTKNLFNVKNIERATANYELSDNKISVLSKDDIAYSQVVYKKIPVQELTTYYLSFESRVIGSGTSRISIYYYDENNIFISEKTFYSSGILETPENAKYIETRVYANVDKVVSAGDGAVYSNIQLTEGSQLYDYEQYGYKIPITVGGKNVYSYGDMSYTGSYSLTLSNPIKAGTYTISALFNNDSDIYNYGLLFYGTKTTIFGNLRYDKGQRTSKTVTFSEDITRLVFYATSTASTNAGVNATFTDIQIEAGTEATEYEPYVESKIYNIYLDEPLRRIGNYADYIDFENSKVVRKIKEVDMSTLSWQYRQDYNVFVSKLDDGISRTELGTNDSYCSHYPLFVGEFTNLPDKSFQNPSNYWSDYSYLIVRDNDYTDLTSFKSSLTNNKPLLNYVLATPTEETIILPSIQILKDSTTLSIDSNGLNIQIEATYYQK